MEWDYTIIHLTTKTEVEKQGNSKPELRSIPSVNRASDLMFRLKMACPKFNSGDPLVDIADRDALFQI